MRLPRASLTTKLFVSYLLVVVVGGMTLFIAADAVAPTFVATHTRQMLASPGMTRMMGGPWAPGSPMEQLLEEAFREAMTQALLVSAATAVVAALVVSVFVSRQIVWPVRRMAQASRRIASGHYAERVAILPHNQGDEIGQLGASFNEMADALEQAERRRLELIGDVAHELRTPVTTLEGYLEGLLDGVVQPSGETWTRLHDEAGRLRRLVDDLQELSRAEARQISLTARAVAPAEIARAALDRMMPGFEEKGLALSANVPSTLPRVWADPDRAIQVLTNLLSNALRYTPAPGKVDITVERVGDTIAIHVRDTGVGLTPEQREHVFDRFYRVDKSRSRALGGSGIGLTISRALVEAMGGRIRATSPGHGKGSTFTFTLPLHQ